MPSTPPGECGGDRLKRGRTQPEKRVSFTESDTQRKKTEKKRSQGSEEEGENSRGRELIRIYCAPPGFSLSPSPGKQRRNVTTLFHTLTVSSDSCSRSDPKSSSEVPQSSTPKPGDRARAQPGA